MYPLKTVVLDIDDRIRAALVAGLREQGLVDIGEATRPGEALRLCEDGSADLLFCGFEIGLPGCVDLLRELARLNPPPAVAFHHAGADIGQIEGLCARLGLYYMGLLAWPVSASRLERLIRQLQEHRKGRLAYE